MVRSDSDEVHIWLVHGTFGARASFLRDDSPLRRAIEAGIGAQRVQFHPFRWGLFNNSSFARAAARRRLEAECRTLLAVGANRRGILVAHSHGGNVALKVANALKRDAIDIELVTLATPFLSQAPRGWRSSLAVMTLLLSAAAGISSSFFRDWLFEHQDTLEPISSSMLSDQSILDALPVMGAALLWCALGAATLLVGFYVLEGLQSDYRTWVQRAANTDVRVNCRALIVSIDADEARRWLGTLLRLARLPAVVGATLLVPLSLHFLGPTIFDNLWAIYFSLAMWWSDWAQWRAALVVIGFGLGLSMFSISFALSILVILLEAVARVMSLAVLGTQVGFGGLLSHVSHHVWSTELPNVSSDVTWRLVTEPSAGGRSMRHTLYEHPTAIEFVSCWISGMTMPQPSRAEAERQAARAPLPRIGVRGAADVAWNVLVKRQSWMELLYTLVLFAFVIFLLYRFIQ